MDNTVNVDISVVYYWYDHLVLRENGDAEIIQKAIQEGDFDTFSRMCDKYPSYLVEDEDGAYFVDYFPDTALIWYQDEIVGEIYITNKIGFSMITDSEYECG